MTDSESIGGACHPLGREPWCRCFHRSFPTETFPNPAFSLPAPGSPRPPAYLTDVSHELAQYVGRLLHAERHRRGIFRATAIGYLDEVITVLAEQAPDLHEALRRAQSGPPLVILAEKVFSTDRAARRPPAIKQPADGQVLDVDNRAYSALLRGLRCLGKRGFALLSGRWRSLRHITASLSRVGAIAKAALTR